ncbi:MAG: ATP-grasp domain-containing protein [Lachnospiraceae bacterium]|nr:ATP-grasp domain-containing protein [Lachnospiraceae bacterium]
MEFIEREFVPLLFGGDINVYSMARAFYEQYKVKSVAIGKFMASPDAGSRIIDYSADPGVETDEVFLRKVREVSEQYADKKVLAIGCGDSYVNLLSKYRDSLPENVIAPYVDYELLDSLQNKEYFYKLCDEHGIDHPATFVYDASMGHDVPHGFEYPVILKPSVGVKFWEHPYEGQSKVYYIGSEEELLNTLDDIYNAGYPDKMIIQDTIPGKDDKMRVLTCYSDKNGKVKMMCLGHVLLEEHQPHGRGNHAVIITEPEHALEEQVKSLLESLDYRGFSNFDIKFDTRDGKYKFFEINTRQGRSNYYVTGSGLNLAKYVVSEYIYGQELEFETAEEEHLWLVVPVRVARKYVHDKDCLNKLNRLLKENKYVDPMFMKGDNKIKRRLKILKDHFRHFGNFKKYYE